VTTTKNIKKPRAGTKTQYTTEKAIAAIQKRIIDTETGCHEWQGPRTKDGYGQLGDYWIIQQFNIKLVHRLMVHLTTGHVFTSRSEQVMHACHNRSCCNPDHLSIGTAKENYRQAWERGSHDNTNIGAAGEANYSAKLTEAQVREIRTRRAAGERATELAVEFGVSESTVSDIHLRRRWKHMD
jgi:hypothetical protein